MKKLYSTLLFTLLISMVVIKPSKSQNLIVNGDFEQFLSCPVTFSQIDSTIGWTTPTALVSTDYFNTCAPLSSLVGVPVNQGTGYQYPHSGNGYAGFFLYVNTPETREYIETELTSPLVTGECYHFEMYVNLLNGIKYTTDDIQIYFSDTLLDNIPSTVVLPFVPQIENIPGNYFDTLTWNHVQLNYTAGGGEKFLVIGNFKSDSNTSLQQIAPNAFPAVYSYIDDVSLTFCTGLIEQDEMSITVGPNPFQDEISLTVPGSNHNTLEIYDMLSKRVIAKDFCNHTTVSAAHLSRGSYYYRIYNRGGIMKTGKIFKP